MAISEEESKKIKEHLLKQLSNFPEDKRSQIKNQIESMTTEQVETFVKQNELNHLGGNCIFCSIVAGNTPSTILKENEEFLAILELNPLSKGHILILPKKHLENFPDSIKDFAKKIADILKNKLKPKEIKLNETKIMEHPILELIPAYEGEKSERRNASVDELKKLRDTLLEEGASPKKSEEENPLSPTPKKK